MIITPRPYQLTAVSECRQAVRDGFRRLILQAACGCHDPNQEILLYDGSLKQVQDIVTGDLLMGMDSTPRTVLRTIRGAGAMYRIVPTKGDSFLVNEDHVLTLVPTSVANPAHKDQLFDVTVRDFLNYSPWKQKFSLLVRSEGVTFPGTASLPIDPYFLGVLLGDGTLARSIGVSNPDPEIVAITYRQAQAYGLSVRVDQEGTSSATYHLTAGRQFQSSGGNPLLKQLQQLGLHGTTCDNKFIPKRYQTASPAQRYAILAGLLDTDGYLSNGVYEYSTKSARLAKDTAFVARSLGLACYIQRTYKTCQTGNGGEYYRLSISGHTDRIPCQVPRKKATPRQQVKNVCRTGFRIEPVGEGEFCGFTLDGDGRYLLDDFTITHNSGKTVMGCMLIEGALAKNKRTLFLANARELIRQCSDKLNSFGIHHGIIMRGHSYTPSAVQLASKDTLLSRAVRGESIPLPWADLIIVDEAHLSLSQQFMHLLEHYPHAIVVGLTATPTRSDGKGLGQYYETMIQAVSSKQLIQEGHLVGVKIYAPFIPNLKKVHTSRGDYVNAELAELMDKPKLVGDIVKTWQDLGEDRQTIAHCVNIAHSKSVQEAFAREGIHAVHVDKDTPPKDRARIFDEFRSGIIKILTNCGVCVTGVDFPVASCAIMARPTKSFSLFRQSTGRVLRPYDGPLGTKKDALILDHAGCCLIHGFPDEDVDWQLEAGASISDKVAKKLDAGDMKKPIVCPTCFFIFHSTDKCPQCGNILPKKKRTPPKGVTGYLTEMPRDVTASDGQQYYIRLWQKCLAMSANRNSTLNVAAGMFISETQGKPPWTMKFLPNLPDKRSDWSKKTAELFPQYIRRRRYDADH